MHAEIRKMSRQRVIAACFIVFLGSLLQAVYADVRMGVVAPRTYTDTAQRWSPFGKYLSEIMGEKVEIVPLLSDQLLSTADAGTMDVFFTHSSHVVYLLEKAQGKPLVTLNTLDGTRFGGVLVAKKGAGITTAKDVKGKRVSTSSRDSAGAYHFPLYHLYKSGVLEKDLAQVMELKKQDNSLLSLANGVVDVAFIRTGVFEQLVKEGSIKSDDYVIVDNQHVPDFNTLLSTDLYPEWYVTATPKVSTEWAQKLKTALLAITPESEVAKQTKIKGFVEPLDVTPVREMLKNLKFAPYN